MRLVAEEVGEELATVEIEEKLMALEAAELVREPVSLEAEKVVGQLALMVLKAG